MTYWRWKRENAIFKREEVFEHMSIALVNTIRKLGWPDSNGRWQYGNAALLCYLSCNNAVQRIAEQYKDVRVVDLIARYA